MKYDPDQAIHIDYVNWKDERELRHVIPIKLWWGHTEWHKENQWLLTVWDLDKQAQRDYALSGFKGCFATPPIQHT